MCLQRPLDEKIPRNKEIIAYKLFRLNAKGQIFGVYYNQYKPYARNKWIENKTKGYSKFSHCLNIHTSGKYLLGFHAFSTKEDAEAIKTYLSGDMRADNTATRIVVMPVKLKHITKVGVDRGLKTFVAQKMFIFKKNQKIKCVPTVPAN